MTKQFRVGQLVRIGNESNCNITPNSGIGWIAEDWSQPSHHNYTVLILWCESYVGDNIVCQPCSTGDIVGFNGFELSPL